MTQQEHPSSSSAAHYCHRKPHRHYNYSCYNQCPWCKLGKGGGGGGDNSISSVRCSEKHTFYGKVSSHWNGNVMMGTLIPATRRMVSLGLVCGLLFMTSSSSAFAEAAVTTEPGPSSSLEDFQVDTVPQTAHIPGNCSQVKCPPAESCPEDSYRLPSLVTAETRRYHEKNVLSSGGVLSPQQQTCCPAPSPQKCQCIPDLLCAPKECSAGWVAQVSKNATGKPGGCCPKYECLPSPAASSTSGGRKGSSNAHHHHPHSHQQQQSQRHTGLNYHHPPEKLDGTSLHPLSSSAATDFDSDIGFDLSSLEEDDDDDSSSEEDSALSHEFSREDNLLQSQKQKFLEGSEESNQEIVSCSHDGKIYKSGDRWTVQSECSECFCEHGLVSCKPISCNVPAECRLARAQPLSCCPVCDGCVSSSGKAYNMSEVWQEDPCTNCTCQGGRIQCHTSSCKRQHSCSSPKYYPGECCPRCENETPDMGTGHIFDKDSCPFRECHRDISCPNGFRLDKSGCPTCECQKCQSLLACKLSCATGFKVDNFGCRMCECNNNDKGITSDPANNNVIPFPSSSSSWSRNGNYDQTKQQQEIPSSSLSSSGSPTDDTTADQSSSSSSPFSPSVKLDQRNLLGNPGAGNANNKDLIGRDGQQHHHQFQYHNGGNRYYNQHHNDDGDDEPTDADNVESHNDDGLYGYGYGNSNEVRGSSSSSSTTGNSASAAATLAVFCALDSDGVKRMEGEEWSDHCRRCVCRNGREMCSLITCQAPKCEHPIFYPGDCCPRCPVEESPISFNPANVSICLSSDGTERVEGEIWTLSSCLTCTCHSGQVLCAAPECPPTPCFSPKLVDCCLQCPITESAEQGQLENKDGQPDSNRIENAQTSPASSSNTNCLSDDSVKTYTDGEMWKVGACQSCRCEAGQIKCFSAGKCPPLECSRPVLAKNQCCPICLDKSMHKSSVAHHGVEGAFELHHLLNSGDGGSLLKSHNLHHDGATTTTTRVPGGGLEPHCAVLIACLLVVTILLSLYIVRQVCFHRRVSRRLIKKVPVGFHSSSSSSHSPSVTPDCCYKCDYSKYCDSGGCVIGVGGGGSSTASTSPGGGGRCTGSTTRGGGGCIGGSGSSRASSTNGSNGHLSSEQKPLFQHDHHHHHSENLVMESQSVSSSVLPSTPTPPPATGPAGLTQSLLRDSDKV